MRTLAAVSACTLALGAVLVAYGCSGSGLEAPLGDGGGSGTSSSGGGESGSAGSGSAAGSSGSGGGSGVVGSGATSGAPGSGSSTGYPGSGSASGVPGSGASTGGASGVPGSGASSGSGGPLCSGSSCPKGDLCCPGFDAYCTPTCMKTQHCPVLGRACIIRPDAGAPADAGSLHWYRTCGYPVCPAPVGGGSSDAAAVLCPALGSSCSVLGQTCGSPDPAVNCGAIEICDNHDPSRGPCPVSSRKYKDNIEYVDDAKLAHLHDETLRMRLATYNYSGQVADPSPTHLGFIIEDQPMSPAVDRMHDRVDMYGYFSMIVATMQVQEKEIAELRQQLEERSTNACGVDTRYSRLPAMGH